MTDQNGQVADDGFSWLQENASLCAISVRNISASKKRPARKSKYELDAKASFSTEEDHVHYKMTFKVDVSTPDGDAVGSLATTIVASYKTESDPTFLQRPDMIKYGNDVAFRDIFPFARQSLTQLATQVDLDARRIMNMMLGPAHAVTPDDGDD